MRDVAILGRDHIKVDSLDKVLGRAKFAADYYMPDMLYGGVFRSTVPHAYIKKLNLEKARALPGVAAGRFSRAFRRCSSSASFSAVKLGSLMTLPGTLFGISTVYCRPSKVKPSTRMPFAA